MEKRISVFILAVISMLLFYQCGKSGEPKGDQTEAQVQEQKELSPNEIGEAASEIYFEAMTKIIDLVKDRPPAAELYPKASELKDKYISKLVELGKAKQKLSPQDKNRVDNKILMGFGRVSSDMMKEFSSAVTYYFGKDEGNKTHFLISSFNIITQYADFDLLKKQAPEEAKRLGVE